MSRRNILSIFMISLAGVFVWFIGFLVIMILKFENTPAVNRGWLIISFGATVVFSVIKNMKTDSGKNTKKDKER